MVQRGGSDRRKIKDRFKRVTKKEAKRLDNKRTRRLKHIVKRFSKKLQKEPHVSDIWFKNKWAEVRMEHSDDEYNVALGLFVPDCINRYFRYVIEVDGSYHLRADQRAKDARKDVYYGSLGYAVFRVISFNNRSFDKLVSNMIKYRISYMEGKKNV
jgi:very-short-patch-repair endonuclease